MFKPTATKHVLATSFSDFGLIKSDPTVALVTMPLVLPPDAQAYADKIDIDERRRNWMRQAGDTDYEVDMHYRRAPTARFNYSSKRSAQDVENWVGTHFALGHKPNFYGLTPEEKADTRPAGQAAFHRAMGNVIHSLNNVLGDDYGHGYFDAKCPINDDTARGNMMQYHNEDTALLINVRGCATMYALNATDDLTGKYPGEVRDELQMQGPHIALHRYGTWHSATRPGAEGRLLYISGGPPPPGVKAARTATANTNGWAHRLGNLFRSSPS